MFLDCSGLWVMETVDTEGLLYVTRLTGFQGSSLEKITAVLSF